MLRIHLLVDESRVVQEGPGVETEGLEQQERLGEEMAQ